MILGCLTVDQDNKRSPNVVMMSSKRRRRWTNIRPACFTKMTRSRMGNNTRYVGFRRLQMVPTIKGLKQHFLNGSCLLGFQPTDRVTWSICVSHDHVKRHVTILISYSVT